MIKLIINPDTSPRALSFNQNEVTIGASGDIHLPDELLHDLHIKIIKQNDGRFIAINCANDPFATVNGFPFGKKILTTRDLLQIGDTVILFEELQHSPEYPDTSNPKILASNDVELEEMLEHTLTQQTQSSQSLIAPVDAALKHAQTNLEAELNQLEQLTLNLESIYPNRPIDLLAASEDTECDFDLLMKQAELDLQDPSDEELFTDTALQDSSLPDRSFAPNSLLFQGTIPPPPHLSHHEPLSLADHSVLHNPLSIATQPPCILQIPPTDESSNSEPSITYNQSGNPHDPVNVMPPSGVNTPLKASLKDYYLSHLDDENQQSVKRHPFNENDQSVRRLNWKLISILFSLVVLLGLLGFSFIYSNMVDRNSNEEMKAATTVADVAMALTYAHMHHIKPQNHNLSDPEFIKNNLDAILADEYTPADLMDIHGQLKDTSYLIRIYPSGDLSQFFVIAQPEPSFLHSIIPRASILVDSRHMEMRKIVDLKDLNRLLQNPNLDGATATEVRNLIQQEELIPLAALASYFDKQGYAPPKSLGILKPGAENLVYNAPRYYHLGENFLKKGLMLAENQSNSDEVDLLQEEMKELSKYPNLVLYTSHGMQWALHAQKAINTFLPDNKLLIGYLKFNAKGLPVTGQLLMDEGSSSEIAFVDTKPSPPHAVPPQETPSPPPIPGATSPNEDPPPPLCEIEPHHPLLMQLCALKAQQQHTTRLFENDLLSLFPAANQHTMRNVVNYLLTHISHETTDPIADDAFHFLHHLQRILAHYDEDLVAQDKEMVQEMAKLYREYSAMPLAEFMEYIHAAGLTRFVQENLKLYEEGLPSRPPDQLIEEHLASINSAKNLHELGLQVENTTKLLTLGKFPDPNKVIAYQDTAHKLVIDKLNDFLLSSDRAMPPEDFIDENRSLLAQTMKNAWISDPDEFDYYLNEFEIRSQEELEHQRNTNPESYR